MKTKIIYISGNEVFDMADIRAAFEEVRNTLGLGNDTIMFGVPVDQDDALATVPNIDAQQEIITETQTADAITDVSETVTDVVTDNAVPETKTEEIQSTPEEKNIKKSTPRKTRTKVKAKAEEEKVISAENDEKQTVSDDSEKIIPILSILASQKDNSDQDNTEITVEPEVIEEPSHEEEEQPAQTVADIDISADFDAEELETDDVHHSAIAEMITDDAPEEPVEKTLEQLLESMTPLREDIIEEPAIEAEDEADAEISDEDLTTSVTEDDTDATLEQLAAEFAENQDKIPAQPKTETHSKIGKLKNILPFKKAKRDDSGLMGDLFGWAGVAANDDDFSIPGFFTNAASKK